MPNRADDFALPCLKPYPRVKPGSYIGVTRTVYKKNFNGMRDYLQILFDLFESPEALGNGEEPIARGVPGFFNLENGRASKYVRLLQLLFPEGLPRGLTSRDLIGKALEVEVVNVDHDHGNKPLPESDFYSKVSKVVARAT